MELITTSNTCFRFCQKLTTVTNPASKRLGHTSDHHMSFYCTLHCFYWWSPTMLWSQKDLLTSSSTSLYRLLPWVKWIQKFFPDAYFVRFPGSFTFKISRHQHPWIYSKTKCPIHWCFSPVVEFGFLHSRYAYSNKSVLPLYLNLHSLREHHPPVVQSTSFLSYVCTCCKHHLAVDSSTHESTGLGHSILGLSFSAFVFQDYFRFQSFLLLCWQMNGTESSLIKIKEYIAIPSFISSKTRRTTCQNHFSWMIIGSFILYT